jgi:adenylate kinase
MYPLPEHQIAEIDENAHQVSPEQALTKFMIMGVPGSGKGTQAQLLCERFDWVHVSVGDILRWHIHNHTKLGTAIRRMIGRGEMVTDSTANAIIHQRLQMHDWNHGLVLDGFPRTVPQAHYLFEHFQMGALIYLDVPDAVVVERISNRRTCRKCASIVNLLMTPCPDNICPKCGANLMQRAEDSPDAVRLRMSKYHALTSPIYEVIAKHCPVIRIDGTRPVDLVQKAIQEAVSSFRNG